MLERLSPVEGSKKNRKRLGRGQGCHGKTSGRGHKGQRARAGGRVSRWFEGGQTPLKLRTPKRGFKNIFKKEYELVNTGQLDIFENDQDVTITDLSANGLVSGKKPVKILGTGDINKKLNIKIHSFSKTAAEKIEKAGGKIESL